MCLVRKEKSLMGLETALSLLFLFYPTQFIIILHQHDKKLLDGIVASRMDHTELRRGVVLDAPRCSSARPLSFFSIVSHQRSFD